MFHGFSEFVLDPSSSGKASTNSGIPNCQLNTCYGLWMRVKGPHNYMIMALGLCVKWALDTLISFLNLLHVIKKPNLRKVTVIRSYTLVLLLVWSHAMYFSFWN